MCSNKQNPEDILIKSPAFRFIHLGNNRLWLGKETPFDFGAPRKHLLLYLQPKFRAKGGGKESGRRRFVIAHPKMDGLERGIDRDNLRIQW